MPKTPVRFVLAACALGAAASAQNLVRDVNSLAPNNPDSNPQQFVDVGNDTYFTASAGAGNELYRIDGQTGVTAIVRDIHPGTGSSSPRQ